MTASAGNHGQGVAWGSEKVGVGATIFMPKSAPLVKVQNTLSLGAQVKLEGDSYQDAYEAATEFQKKEGLTYVHAYEDEERFHLAHDYFFFRPVPLFIFTYLYLKCCDFFTSLH